MFRSEYSELFVSTNITCITDVNNAAKTKYRKTLLGVFAKKSGCLTKCENVQRIRVINAFAKLQAKPCNYGSRKCVETKLLRKNEGKNDETEKSSPKCSCKFDGERRNDSWNYTISNAVSLNGL